MPRLMPIPLLSPALALGALLLLPGCALVSPAPLWELTKVTGTAAAMAIPYGESHASDTVYHLHRRFHSLCIAYNPDTPAPGLVPALQAELRLHQIDSRVYDGTLPESCAVSLHYTATIAWDTPPLGGSYQPYVTGLSLALRQTDTGQVLSSSAYALDSTFGWGKWSPTQAKLSPVVTALITGFEG